MKFLSFLLILLTCQVVFSQEIAYPLAIGNRWIYSVEGIATKTVEITGDTVMSNGKQYRVLTGLDEQFQRFEDNKVFVYDSAIESERLQYDFTAAPGDTILTYVLEQDTADIVFLYVENTFTFGAWRQRFWFNYELRHTTDMGWSNAITDSIGLDVHTAFAGWFYLLGAEINGKTYGDINDVNQKGSILPKAFQLHQNYHNPFNPKTVISWQLAVGSDVDLSIYNLLGQKVRTLVAGKQKAGIHKVEWNAAGISGGVYYYRLVAGEYVATKKLVLVK